MKRLVSVCVALCLAASSCTDQQAEEGDAAGSAPLAADGTQAPDGAAQPTRAPSDAESPAGGARTVTEETDDFVFEYAYPVQAGAIPELAALLDRRLERARASLTRQAAEGRAAARDNGFPYNKYSSGMEWRLVADLTGWLSLSGRFNSYTGGAHGIYGVESMVWDKEAGRALRAVDLFTSPQALSEALGDRFCEGLDRLRAERREEPVEGDEYGFNACPSVDELTVLVGSENARTFNRMTLYAGPYVAGPYAEGAYEINLDVDEAVLAAVKTEYRDSFSARR